MGRLFTGQPTRTDGKLTKKKLWREAGVGRATMNRATAVLAEWDNRVGRSPASVREPKSAGGDHPPPPTTQGATGKSANVDAGEALAVEAAGYRRKKLRRASVRLLKGA
jgi:hypothetical protein